MNKVETLAAEQYAKIKVKVHKKTNFEFSCLAGLPKVEEISIVIRFINELI
jgi:hypothetical protein